MAYTGLVEGNENCCINILVNSADINNEKISLRLVYSCLNHIYYVLNST